MDPHVFCGPEFILEVPSHSVKDVLQRVESTVATAPADSASVESNDSHSKPSPSSGASPAPAWTVQPSLLLRIQTEIYSCCTADVRRQIHAQLALKACVAKDVRAAMAMVSRRMAHFNRIQLPADYADAGHSTGSVSRAPSTVAFVEVKPTNAMSAEEVSSIAQSVRAATTSTSSAAPSPGSDVSPVSSSASSSNTLIYLLLYITDSRAAAQLHMLCLRNTYLALPSSCRLLNYFVFGGRAAAIVPRQILQKRELLKTHFNFDAELWGVLAAKLTNDLVEEVRACGRTQDTQQGNGRLLTAFERHEQDVAAVLRYCEQKVHYAGVFDDDEEASPFLIAMGLCWRLSLTMDDVCRHFARHPRRVIRALALYLARYVLAPEDYVYFFLPSLTDEVIIACTEDAQVTYTMKDLSRQLLTKNDIVDAWLPMLAKYWQDQVVAPSMTFMEACWQLQGRGDESRDAATAADASSPTSSAALFRETDGSTKADEADGFAVRGAGRGIAATFGFRSIAEIAEHAAQHSRVLVPQSMATILKRRRGIEEEVFGVSAGAGGGGGGNDAAVDALDDLDDDDDDFLIHVDVRGDDEDEDGGDRRVGAPPSRRARPDQTGGTASPSAAGGRGGALTDPHRRIMREGLKLTLSLLGRRKLFRDNDEHYIEF
ncbi:hypothetical protein ABB37_05396 [Leptomonas pyrrhocoris]|uniref:Uncharacterized protein n=1 Tax=Leptomonas pyrrhocoris TaxID=157538 RepID=A0A0N0DUZ1_LEPPY|nr:hypothetical protein ABB37_05396 [Leptomonas pyrrhocoris]KPA79591.1 hypothetical protein ABB37_05396 [Leptomonas pyrrhocoris]|eukprot:XP_015658030.1 hypothetical protein ABB37_05396 [Leptomonas pyrrhocoris]